jgi:hypothetical protein
MLPHMAIVAGALVIPSVYGSKIYIGMSPAAFRDGVLCLLIFAGAVMVVAGLRILI